MSKYGRWVLCVGCGKPVGLFPDGCAELGFEPGVVAHSKPEHLEGIPNSVPCDLYKTTSAETFTLLHAAEKEIDPPRSITRGKEYR